MLSLSKHGPTAGPTLRQAQGDNVDGLNVTAWRRGAVLAAVAFAFVASAATVAPARAQAVSPLDFGTEFLGDVRLGVALATTAELADAPELLARPSSQRFVDDALARVLVETADPAVRAAAGRYRDDLRAAPGAPFDRTRADADAVAFTRDVLHALPAPRDRLCVAGILAEQTAYNARVLRSAADDAQLRKALGATSAADSLVSGLGAARARLAALPAERWSEIADAAGGIVASMLGPLTTPPFPPSDGVWAVLLRSRPTEAAAIRHGTPHLWLEIVRFDGTRRTIGGYSGSGDWALDSRALTCDFDKEGERASEGAVPVAPPPGTTLAQLAKTLTERCTAAAKSPPPYRAREASDARFIVDLLLAAGVDAASVLHVK